MGNATRSTTVLADAVKIHPELVHKDEMGMQAILQPFPVQQAPWRPLTRLLFREAGSYPLRFLVQLMRFRALPIPRILARSRNRLHRARFMPRYVKPQSRFMTARRCLRRSTAPDTRRPVVPLGKRSRAS